MSKLFHSKLVDPFGCLRTESTIFLHAEKEEELEELEEDEEGEGGEGRRTR